MRRAVLTAVTLLLLSAPLEARSKEESFVSYDDGETVVVQSDDHREIEARVNLPLFPGDEVRTSRRGRAEIRLADGNVIALDGNTAVRLNSVANSYDGESSDTIIQLLHGTAMVHRLERGSSIRLDSENASYLASRDGTYSVEMTSRGHDVLSVYEGSIEARTRNDVEKVRAGEEVRLDADGIYGTNTLVRDGTTDFERWSLRRAERWGQRSSRYLDGGLSYASSDLDANGSWVYVNDYNSWAWRPTVSVGWRPYHNGWWRPGRSGQLHWVSEEPWGWVPYHYGRWTWSSIYGWFWLPGYGYSPGWVYWVYGPSYVGWVPAGWYDCYPGYYNWLYRPYSRVGISAGFGFHGRIRIGDIDSRAWTFVRPDTLVSNRIDRAALTTDAIRSRLTRDGSEAILTNHPARFTRDEIQDPSSAVRAISRRGIGSGTGKESSGSPADVTSFFRRDPELSTSIRERLVRGVDTGGGGSEGGRERSIGPSKNENPSSSAPEVRDRISRGSIGAPRVAAPGSRVIDRENKTPEKTRQPVVNRPNGGSPKSESPPDRSDAWRSRVVQRPSTREKESQPESPRQPQFGYPGQPSKEDRPRTVDRPAAEPPATDWREGEKIRREAPPSERQRDDAPERERNEGSESDVPRRVIDRIGGARVTPSERSRPSRASEPKATSPRDSSPRVARPPSDNKPSSPPPKSDKPARSESGGRVKRNQG